MISSPNTKGLILFYWIWGYMDCDHMQ